MASRNALNSVRKKHYAASQKALTSAMETLSTETRRLLNLFKERAFAEIFAEADKRAKRLEGKLEALGKREDEHRFGSKR